MKAICYVLTKREGAKLRKVTQSLERVAARSDEGLLETYAPSAGRVAAWADKGWTLCNWHIVNFTPKSLTHTKHKTTMNDTILVVLPDGNVHRATLIEPDLGAPVYQLGKKAGAKERKPRTKASTSVIGRGLPASPPPSGVAQVSNT